MAIEQDVAGHETDNLVVRIEEASSNGHIPTDEELDKLFNQDEDTRPQWMREYGQTLTELNEEDIADVAWIVPDLLTEGLTVLAGYLKSGKSYLALNIGIAVASGDKVLGETQVEPGRVLYVTMDDKQKAGIRARIQRIRKGAKSDIPLDVYTNWAPLDGIGSDRNGTNDLIEYMTFYPNTKLIIIDVLMNVLPEVKDGVRAYADIYKKLGPVKDAAQKHHVAIMLVMHTKKQDNSDKGINPRSAIYGDQAYGSIADNLLIIAEDYQTHKRTLLTYGKYLEETEIDLDYDPNTNIITYGTKRVAELKAKDESRNVVAIVNAEHGITRTQVINKLMGTGMGDSAASQSISRALKSGKIVNIEGKVGYYPFEVTQPDYDPD